MDSADSFADHRGVIKDLLITPEYSVTYITFTEGAVRGNHYHKETTQIDLVLSGELISVRSTDGKKANYTMFAGDRSKFPAGVAHAYKATKPSSMISICWGVRRGTNYEADTYRLEEPLI